MLGFDILAQNSLEEARDSLEKTTEKLTDVVCGTECDDSNQPIIVELEELIEELEEARERLNEIFSSVSDEPSDYEYCKCEEECNIR